MNGIYVLKKKKKKKIIKKKKEKKKKKIHLFVCFLDIFKNGIRYNL